MNIIKQLRATHDTHVIIDNEIYITANNTALPFGNIRRQLLKCYEMPQCSSAEQNMHQTNKQIKKQMQQFDATFII